jgi:RNA polymerase sigma-70 factor (ECF subfamily)
VGGDAACSRDRLGLRQRSWRCSLPFDAVAKAVGRTVPACRQLATRARRKIADSGRTRFSVTSAEHRVVTEKFIAAASRGDLDGLLAVLAPDAWGDVDYGPQAGRPHMVVTGGLRVARHLLHFWGPGVTLVTHPGAAQPALLGFTGRDLTGVLVLSVRGERVQAVHVIADPVQVVAVRVGQPPSEHPRTRRRPRYSRVRMMRS